MTELIGKLRKDPSAAAAGECCTAEAVANLYILPLRSIQSITGNICLEKTRGFNHLAALGLV